MNKTQQNQGLQSEVRETREKMKMILMRLMGTCAFFYLHNFQHFCAIKITTHCIGVEHVRKKRVAIRGVHHFSTRPWPWAEPRPVWFSYQQAIDARIAEALMQKLSFLSVMLHKRRMQPSSPQLMERRAEGNAGTCPNLGQLSLLHLRRSYLSRHPWRHDCASGRNSGRTKWVEAASDGVCPSR